MRDLHPWLTNPFDAANIGIDNLLAFTTSHLIKMTDKNVGGFLTTRIAATTVALAAVNTAFQTDSAKSGERMTAKQVKTAYRAVIKTGLGKIFIALQTKYGEKAGQLKTFFPNGRTKINQTRDDQMGNALQALITELTKYQGEVGATLVTEATALLTGWNAVYTPSEAVDGAKDTSKDAKNTARLALQLELFKNLLTIALQFPRQPEKVDAYMQPSLLEPITHSPTPPPTHPA